jgi:hypothetical protein
MRSDASGWSATGRRLLAIVVGCALLGAAVGGAAAKTFNIKIEGDKELVIGEPTIADENCRSGGLWTVKVLKEPAHGKFIVKKTLNTMTTEIIGSTKCAGRQVPGLTLSYMPDKGFRGEDAFSFRMTSNVRGHASYDYELHLLVE